MKNTLTDEEGDDDIVKQLKRQARIECRTFARLFKTQDGKTVLESIKRDIGWNEAGPGDLKMRSLRHWVGQRSVIVGIANKISMGEKLLHEPETNETP